MSNQPAVWVLVLKTLRRGGWGGWQGSFMRRQSGVHLGGGSTRHRRAQGSVDGLPVGDGPRLFQRGREWKGGWGGRVNISKNSARLSKPQQRMKERTADGGSPDFTALFLAGVLLWPPSPRFRSEFQKLPGLACLPEGEGQMAISWGRESGHLSHKASGTADLTLGKGHLQDGAL